MRADFLASLLKARGSPVQATGVSWLRRRVLGHEDKEVSLSACCRGHPPAIQGSLGRGGENKEASQARPHVVEGPLLLVAPQPLLHPSVRNKSFRHQQERTLPVATIVGEAKVLGSPNVEGTLIVSREGCADLGYFLVLSCRSGKAVRHSATVLFLQSWVASQHLPLTTFQILLRLPLNALPRVYCHS